MFILIGVLSAVQALLGNWVATQFQDRLDSWAGYVLPTFLTITGILIWLTVRHQLADIGERQDVQSDDHQTEQNRRTMLRKVRTIWIDGLLTHSLYHETLIALGLHERPDAVARPLDVLVHLPHQADHPLPPDTRISEVFDECSGALLILGAPGAGKTTLLLELARDLLDRADQDTTHLIPVVFPLSSWAERRLPLVEWLIDELSKRYDVPRTLGQSWVVGDMILPLLDGLDEVNADVRPACVEAINTFLHHKHGLRPLVVSCRITNYEALSVKLRLHGAIVVQPLTRDQVKAYLRQIGLPISPSTTSPLWELLDTPLMLNIATLSYTGQTGKMLPTDGTPDTQRNHLFSAYIARMFQRNNPQIPFSKDQTVQWLSWLAWQMQRHKQTVFYLERMQPTWLPPPQLLVLEVSPGLLGILLMGLLGGVVDGRSYGLIYGLISGLFSGLAGGAVGAGLSRVLVREIEPTDTLRWSWTVLGSGLRSGLFEGLRGGVLFGLFCGLVAGLAGGVLEEQLGGLLIGLLGGLLIGLLGGLLIGLFSGLSSVAIENRTRPNEGIRRSGQAALLVGLVGGLFGGLLGGLSVGLLSRLGFDPPPGLLGGLLGGLSVGLLGGLNFGGDAWLRHHLLRLLLIQQGAMPWRYVRFLDFAAERILLRKVGGGYIFIHRLLLDYFAKQYKGPETTEQGSDRVAKM